MERLESVDLFIECMKIAHEVGIDTETAIKCEGEQACGNCPYDFEGL